MILMDLITLAEKRGFKEMEDGLPQPPPGAGAGLVVSLCPSLTSTWSRRQGFTKQRAAGAGLMVMRMQMIVVVFLFSFVRI